jgi:hypothetical protein
MNLTKMIQRLKSPFVFIGVCFGIAGVIAIAENTVFQASAQPAAGYYTPQTVWGTGIGGMSNSIAGNITNILRINNTANRLGDMALQVTMADNTSGAVTNVMVQLGRSVLSVSPTNTAGAGGVPGYPGIELFAKLLLTLNGTTPVTLVTNLGADAGGGGVVAPYYYVMWISNSATGVAASDMGANGITNLSVSIFTP